MAEPRSVVIDDRLLVEELLAGLPHVAPTTTLHTTTYWYYRACRAAVAGGSGHLSGPFERLGHDHQQQAILNLLHLRPNIALPDPRHVVPVMAEIALRHPRLNLMNLEAIAAAQTLSATLWLSTPATEGVLPPVLDAEGIRWTTVTID